MRINGTAVVKGLSIFCKHGNQSGREGDQTIVEVVKVLCKSNSILYKTDLCKTVRSNRSLVVLIKKFESEIKFIMKLQFGQILTNVELDHAFLSPSAK